MRFASKSLASLATASLVLAATAGSGFADESPAAPAPAMAVRQPSQRLQIAGALDVTQNGLGLQLGLRYSFVELSAGASVLLWRDDQFLGLKAFALPDSPLAPYAYARLGSWHEDAIPFQGSPEQSGMSLAGGGGVELRMGKHAFAFGELGLFRETGHYSQEQVRTVAKDGTDVRLGVGLRF